ncbi:hypothetical protein GWK47_001094 [Chionoecetes opilio]|uniref:Uncharacterized protein n=1 Tax=Chionoecetes opilio TaxID=41210 RepID=A0A8J4XYP6_CHIOP|nr:hypothetical protein GWK47_001094 [Chionoecetes opilio]
MIDVGKLAAVLGSGVCSALPGLHAWSGCDTVSALASQGKIKALKLVQANDLYLQAFTDLGSSWNVPTDVFNSIQAFTCQLYARNTKIVGANSLRYHMFCAKKGQIESGQLPPCEDSLMQHTLRANYQAAIWRRSLKTCQTSQHHQQDMVGNSMMAVRSKSDGWRVYQLQMSS